jgi:hypothetical protein
MCQQNVHAPQWVRADRVDVQWRRSGQRIAICQAMIRKLKTGEYRLYSRKKDTKTGRRRNLGTFRTRDAAEKHERAVQFFKHGG